MANQVYIYILFYCLLLWSLCFITSKHFISTSSICILSVSDEGYSSNVSCTLNLISTFSLCYLGGGEGGGWESFPPLSFTLTSVYYHCIWYVFFYYSFFWRGVQHFLEYDDLSTPLSTLFQQYGGSRFNTWRKPVYPEKTTTYTSPWAGLKRKTWVVIGTDCIGIIAIIRRFFSLDLGTDLTAGFVFYLIFICTVYH